MQTTTEIDARGLNCPLPVLKVQKAMRALSAGARLRVLATDPKAPADVAHFCEATGHALIENRQLPDHFIFVIEKCG